MKQNELPFDPKSIYQEHYAQLSKAIYSLGYHPLAAKRVLDNAIEELNRVAEHGVYVSRTIECNLYFDAPHSVNLNDLLREIEKEKKKALEANAIGDILVRVETKRGYDEDNRQYIVLEYRVPPTDMNMRESVKAILSGVKSRYVTNTLNYRQTKFYFEGEMYK